MYAGTTPGGRAVMTAKAQIAVEVADAAAKGLPTSTSPKSATARQKTGPSPKAGPAHYLFGISDKLPLHQHEQSETQHNIIAL